MEIYVALFDEILEQWQMFLSEGIWQFEFLFHNLTVAATAWIVIGSVFISHLKQSNCHNFKQSKISSFDLPVHHSCPCQTAAPLWSRHPNLFGWFCRPIWSSLWIAWRSPRPPGGSTRWSRNHTVSSWTCPTPSRCAWRRRTCRTTRTTVPRSCRSWGCRHRAWYCD